ncbi:hypothetical protein EYC80_009738 [Monilinia laxa]|uniref:Uncharacterized protein n=1 Tax=Monilinia laxa TaxID=61186 RepID=A0A5N6JZ87_MONLA|nr:hypothetical protein EYC80_009738 [Monilinia laxa]
MKNQVASKPTEASPSGRSSLRVVLMNDVNLPEILGKPIWTFLRNDTGLDIFRGLYIALVVYGKHELVSSAVSSV